MTSVEQQRPRVLIGRVVKVASGVFMFGLSGQSDDREQNLRFLQEETWFDVPLTYRNGASGVLAVEKGADGERAVKAAVADWGRVAAGLRIVKSLGSRSSHGGEGRAGNGMHMRAEIQAIVDDIKQSVGLLRRHL